jgi:translation initiation factor 3 subunit J
LDHVGEQVDIESILNANPKTKEEFIVLSRQIYELVVKRHQDKPLYAAFVEAHAKELAIPLRDVEVRKVASGLTALANEKQKESKDKTGGKKKKAPKPVLGSSKAFGKCVSDPGVHSKFWMFTSVVLGLTRAFTRKLWMTSVKIQMTSCELV